MVIPTCSTASRLPRGRVAAAFVCCMLDFWGGGPTAATCLLRLEFNVVVKRSVRSHFSALGSLSSDTPVERKVERKRGVARWKMVETFSFGSWAVCLWSMVLPNTPACMPHERPGKSRSRHDRFDARCSDALHIFCSSSTASMSKSSHEHTQKCACLLIPTKQSTACVTRILKKWNLFGYGSCSLLYVVPTCFSDASCTA